MEPGHADCTDKPFDLAENLNFNYIKLGYSDLLSRASVFWLPMLAAGALVFVIDQLYFWRTSDHMATIVWLLWLTCGLGTLFIYYFHLSKKIYMLDLSCYKAPQEWRVSFDHFIEHAVISQKFTAKSVEFQKRILERAAVSEFVAVPPALHYLPPTGSALLAAEVDT